MSKLLVLKVTKFFPDTFEKFALVCSKDWNGISTKQAKRSGKKSKFAPSLVGVPGIEPGPLGPKPSTLPLCYTPIVYVHYYGDYLPWANYTPIYLLNVA